LLPKSPQHPVGEIDCARIAPALDHAVADLASDPVAPRQIDPECEIAKISPGLQRRIVDNLQDGVTGWVDCGSAGADNIDQIAAVARAALQIARVLVNISRTGNAPDGELMDINRADVGLARGAIARHRDVVIGVKARLSNSIAGTNDLEGLRRAQEAAAPFNLPVMIHVGQSFSPMRAILPLLKRGDIVTHMYAPF
jgi:predicted amidohydrolase